MLLCINELIDFLVPPNISRFFVSKVFWQLVLFTLVFLCRAPLHEIYGSWTNVLLLMCPSFPMKVCIMMSWRTLWLCRWLLVKIEEDGWLTIVSTNVIRLFSLDKSTFSILLKFVANNLKNLPSSVKFR